jgi:GT2 family glycosyltransferase
MTTAPVGAGEFARPTPYRCTVRLSVIVATVGRTERLLETLKSLSECDPPPDEIIVVDGDASERTRSVVDELVATSRGVLLIYRPATRGLTMQRNVGLEMAASEIVAFVDDDMSFRLTPDVFRHVERGFAEIDVVGVTGQMIDEESRRFGGSRSRVRRLLFGARNEGKFTRFGYPRYLLDPSTEADIEYMPGCFMCVRRDIAREVRFDEALTGYALAEDEDFAYRLSRRGRIRFLPEIVLEHERYGVRDLRATNRALVVNRTYLFRKNFRQTMLAKAEFALLIGVLMGHRLLNGEWSSLRGLTEGIGDVLQGRVPNPKETSPSRA